MRPSPKLPKKWGGLLPNTGRGEYRSPKKNRESVQRFLKNGNEKKNPDSVFFVRFEKKFRTPTRF